MLQLMLKTLGLEDKLTNGAFLTKKGLKRKEIRVNHNSIFIPKSHIDRDEADRLKSEGYLNEWAKGWFEVTEDGVYLLEKVYDVKIQKWRN